MEIDSAVPATNEAPEPRTVGPSRDRSRAQRPAILIADGNPNTAPMLPAALRERGHEVLTMPLPLFVQSIALRRKPSAILLGANLPVGGAATILRRLRAYVDTAAIPVLALVPAGSEKESLLAAGADECLEPSASDAEILAALEARLSKPHEVAVAPAEIIRDPVRLAALEATRLMDTDPEAELDAVTFLASRLLRVPVALVSLVDHRRQFFKSAVGLPAPWDEIRETPVSDSFCQWVVSSREGLIVADARTHPVLRNSRAITDLGIIAYLGVPLTAPTGENIGSFCAIDAQPHPWRDEEIAVMRDLAQLVDAHISLYSPVPAERRRDLREKYLRAAMRTAGRGFFGAARLLRRSRALLGEEDFTEVISLIERHSSKLIDLVAESPSAQ